MSLASPGELDRLVDDLQAQGINWLTYIPAAADAAVLLFFAFGPVFGRKALAKPTAAQPFDELSLSLARDFAAHGLGVAAPDVLYPGGRDISLLPWLTQAQVQFESPLGLGIRPDCGPWFAVRAALLLPLPQAARAFLDRRFPRLAANASPCTTCLDKPCIAACPAHAVTNDAPFNLKACVNFRAGNHSPCASTCLARLACPVGRDYRYDEAQIAYHYERALVTIRTWLRQSRHES
jgi:hypothetical protein